MSVIASVRDCVRQRQMLPGGFASACAAVAAALAGVPSIASAQSAGTADGSVTLEEVVVTAERRSEDLQRTAVAVSVRDGVKLQAEGKFTLEQILEDIPSISFTTPYAVTEVTDVKGANVIIRGVSANGVVPGSALSLVPSIATYVDGVVSGLGGGYDIERVEVLRGPQGTLYGRSATGGVVNLQTRDPELGEFGGNAAAEAGNYSLQHYSAALNLPAGDVFAARFAGNYYSRDGYYSKDGEAIDIKEGRAKLLYKPGDSFSALLGFAITDANLFAGGQQGFVQADKSVSYLTVPVGEGKEIQRQFWAEINWDLGPVNLTYLPALQTYEVDTDRYGMGSPQFTAVTNQNVSDDTFHTQELRLASDPDARVKWQGGLFYYDNDLEGLEYLQVLNGFIVLHNSITDRHTQNFGVFAESTLPLNDTLRLTAGLRYDYTKVATASTDCYDLARISCVSLTEEQGTNKWNTTTYKLRLEQDLTPANLLYGSISTGFLPGDSTLVLSVQNNGELRAASYDSETVTSFEVGSKNRFLNDALQLNGSLFYYRYGGRQEMLNVGTVNLGGVLISAFEPSSSPAKFVGAEAELLWQASSADRIGLNVSYVDARYKDKPPAFADAIAQEKIPGVIPFRSDLTYSHTFGLPTGQALTLNAQALYQSGYDVNSMTAAQVAGGLGNYIDPGSQLTGNLNLVWDVTANVSLSAYVRNVSDETWVRYISPLGSASTPPIRAIESDPRTYGVVLSASF